MLFNSFVFFLFLFVVLPVVYFLPSKYKKIFLIFASYVFYGYWDWRFTSLLMISTLVDFFLGQAIFHEQRDHIRKRFLFASLATNLGILGFFKYFSFFTESFNEAFSFFGYQLDFVHMNIILPVGISFYTFQTLSYTIDIYRRQMEPTKSLIDFSLFVSFFPQLVAGPIERAKNLLPQLSNIRKPGGRYFREGITLIVIGLFRKVIIGDTTGRIADQIFSEPGYYGWLELTSGLLLFSFQIYNDFAGYSHIARGTARLLNIDLMENFNQPYLSKNITEFWRRWHISLSSWLRDYLYITLGGNRKGNVRTYVNLMLTMLLGGLWHGASWTFVVWGGLHGIYLAVHKKMMSVKNVKIGRLNKEEANSISFFDIPSMLATFALVLLTWLFFRAPDFGTAYVFLERIFSLAPGSEGLRMLKITLSLASVSFLIDYFEYTRKNHTFILNYKKAVAFPILITLWVYSMLYIFQADAKPFIYFQF